VIDITDGYYEGKIQNLQNKTPQPIPKRSNILAYNETTTK